MDNWDTHRKSFCMMSIYVLLSINMHTVIKNNLTKLRRILHSISLCIFHVFLRIKVRSGALFHSKLSPCKIYIFGSMKQGLGLR